MQPRATARRSRRALVCRLPPGRRRDIHSWRSRLTAALPLCGMRSSQGCAVSRSRESRAPASSQSPQILSGDESASNPVIVRVAGKRSRRLDEPIVGREICKRTIAHQNEADQHRLTDPDLGQPIRKDTPSSSRSTPTTIRNCCSGTRASSFSPKSVPMMTPIVASASVGHMRASSAVSTAR